MKAWLFQDTRQKAKHGDKAPWCVGFYHDGKKKSRTFRNKSLAEKHLRKIEGELAAGTFEDPSKATWQQFLDEYESRVLVLKALRTKECAQLALNHFTKIVAPKRSWTISSRDVAKYVATRRTAGASPATINKELRHLKAIFRKAVKWKFLREVPDVEFLREPGKLPTHVAPEEFVALYAACDSMRWPEAQTFSTGDWWRALLVTAYMTGWRIGSLLSLRWEHTDLEAGTVTSLAENNKGKLDIHIALNPIVVEHLEKLRSFGPLVFPWNHTRRAIFGEFGKLQEAAGVKAKGKARYGFHDLRRAFATLNADRLSADVLQALMQHRDYKTTQRYIDISRQLKPAAENLYVPELPRSVYGVSG